MVCTILIMVLGSEWSSVLGPAGPLFFERSITCSIISNANENLIIELLPIIDDVERSLKSTPKGGKEKEVHKGFELIYQKLILTLQGFGVEAMTSIGKEFDVEEHDAILQVEQKETPSSIVVEEHEKGYLLDGKVIRHAKVIVSK